MTTPKTKVLYQFTVEERRVIDIHWSKFLQAVDFVRTLHSLENTNCQVSDDRSCLLTMDIQSPLGPQ